MTNKLARAWPDLLQWLECCVQRGIENDHIPMQQRLETKNKVVALIGVYTTLQVLDSVLCSTRTTLIPLVMRIWLLECLEPRLHFMSSCCKGSFCDQSVKTNAAALLFFAFQSTQKPSIDDLNAVFEAMPNHARFIARVALYNLRRNSRRGHIGHLGFNFEIDVAIIKAMTPHAPLGRPLLAQGSVVEITNALVVNLNRMHEIGYSLVDAKRGITHCFYYLQTALTVGNGITWITDALHAHLLLAILVSSRSSEKDIVGYCVEFLSSILPSYLVYGSVVVAAGRGVVHVEKHQSQISGLSHEVERHWTKYKELVNTGLHLAGRKRHGVAVDLHEWCSYVDVSRLQCALASC